MLLGGFFSSRRDEIGIELFRQRYKPIPVLIVERQCSDSCTMGLGYVDIEQNTC